MQLTEAHLLGAMEAVLPQVEAVRDNLGTTDALERVGVENAEEVANLLIEAYGFESAAYGIGLIVGLFIGGARERGEELPEITPEQFNAIQDEANAAV